MFGSTQDIEFWPACVSLAVAVVVVIVDGAAARYKRKFTQDPSWGISTTLLQQLVYHPY